MAKRKKLNSSAPSQPYPAISVIIPLYNAEKYIAESLDSLLAQTFQDFELIIVDDCSTDSSCDIVESYREKFGGRLKLKHMRKNSGSATEPRNMGIAYAHGEYLYFMDNDDFIMPTGLEELYILAKKYDVDVVQCEKNYELTEEKFYDRNYIKNNKPSCHPAKDKVFITQPTLLDDDLAKRAVSFSKKWLTWSIWIQLIRREFVLENNLKFVGVVLDDMLFTICEICSAKKYLVVPNVMYIHRNRPDSLLWQDLNSAEKFINSRIFLLKEGINYLDKYLSDREPFAKRPDLKYIIFNMFTQSICGHFEKIYKNIPAPRLDTMFRKEFSDGNSPALTSFIFNLMNIHRLKMKQTQKKFRLFAAQAQARIAQLEAEVNRLKSKE